MSFGPDPEKARALDARMHRGLKESLDHICEAVGIGARETGNETDRRALTELHEIISTLPEMPHFPPAAFGSYYELAFALIEDELAAAQTAAANLRTYMTGTGNYGPAAVSALGQDEEQDAIYMRRLGGLEGASFNPPAESAVAEFGPRLEAGRSLLRRCAPELLEEIDVIVREIVLAVGKPEEKIQFDGGSAYQLWGLLFLNPAFHPTPVAMAEVLAHESGHSILFGHTYDEPLVFNPDTELYPSALRLDPRPMDGIYHATYVSARMHWTMSRIADDPSMSVEERESARKAAVADTVNFAKGIAVIDAHGRLSDTGRKLMDEARAYMSSAV